MTERNPGEDEASDGRHDEQTGGQHESSGEPASGGEPESVPENDPWGDEKPSQDRKRFDARRDRTADATGNEDAPLSGLRADIEERRQQRQSSTPDVDEVFEEAGSAPVVDGEQIWEDLLAGHEEVPGLLAFGEAVEEGTSEDVTIIPNRVCHSCKHFGDPPELHCTHEGTTIRRMVDMDRYEVVECPVVKNRSDLQE